MFGRTDPNVWLHYADNSYVSSRLLFFTGFMLEAPVGAHRTLELYLKTLLVARGVEVRPGSPAWGHRLSQLGTVAAEVDASFGQEPLQRRLHFFERYFDYVRYPNDDGPEDGSLVWFSFDANIAPLDEAVAFIRPRIPFPEEAWRSSAISRLLAESEPQTQQHRALLDGNDHINLIACEATGAPGLTFREEFSFDKPGC